MCYRSTYYPLCRRGTALDRRSRQWCCTAGNVYLPSTFKVRWNSRRETRMRAEPRFNCVYKNCGRETSESVELKSRIRTRGRRPGNIFRRRMNRVPAFAIQSNNCKNACNCCFEIHMFIHTHTHIYSC